MKKVILILILSMSYLHSVAQQDNKIQLNMGGGLDFFPVTSVLNGMPAFQAPLSFYSVVVSVNYLLAHSQDMYSLSVEPALHFSLWGGGGGFSAYAQLPTYGMAKIGALSTPYNNQIIGAGIGVGLNPSYIYMPYASSTNQLLYLNTVVFSPVACAQISFNYRSNSFTIRYQQNILPFRSTMPINSFKTDDIPIDITSFGISLIYNR